MFQANGWYKWNQLIYTYNSKYCLKLNWVISMCLAAENSKSDPGTKNCTRVFGGIAVGVRYVLKICEWFFVFSHTLCIYQRSARTILQGFKDNLDSTGARDGNNTCPWYSNWPRPNGLCTNFQNIF